MFGHDRFGQSELVDQFLLARRWLALDVLQQLAVLGKGVTDFDLSELDFHGWVFQMGCCGVSGRSDA